MLVVDTSVALKWFVKEEGSGKAADLLVAPVLLVAPDLIVAGVCNAAWKAVRSGRMAREQQEHAASRLAAAFNELVALGPLAAHAVAISRELDHSVYDCFCLALSEQRDAQFVTADRSLPQRVVGTEWAGRSSDLCSFGTRQSEG